MDFKDSKSFKISYWRIVALLLFALYFISCVVHPNAWHFIDNVDLIIHEAGHFIFVFFGEFISILGGSLLQVLIPIVFAAYFFIYREFFSASLLLFWVGYNFVNVSIYAGDAIVVQLPLLGGDSSIHDWNYLLTQLNILQYTHTVASVIYGIGIFVIVTACMLGLRYALMGDENGYRKADNSVL